MILPNSVPLGPSAFVEQVHPTVAPVSHGTPQEPDKYVRPNCLLPTCSPYWLPCAAGYSAVLAQVVVTINDPSRPVALPVISNPKLTVTLNLPRGGGRPESVCCNGGDQADGESHADETNINVRVPAVRRGAPEVKRKAKTVTMVNVDLPQKTSFSKQTRS